MKKKQYQKVEVTIEKTYVIEWHDSSTKNEARKKTYDYLEALIKSDKNYNFKKLINKSKTKVITIKGKY